jgi:hypothetical protein
MTQARNAQTAALEALIEAHAMELKLPTFRRRFRALAEEALHEQQTPVAYLGALLEAEHQERAERRERRRLIDAGSGCDSPGRRSRRAGVRHAISSSVRWLLEGSDSALEDGRLRRRGDRAAAAGEEPGGRRAPCRRASARGGSAGLVCACSGASLRGR